MVLSFGKGPKAACQPWHALQLHVAPKRPWGHSDRDQSRSASHVEDPRRTSRCPQGNSRPYPKPRVAGREFEELRPLELHARKTGRHGEMGQIRSRDAGQEAAAEAGRVTKDRQKPPAPLHRTPDYESGGQEFESLHPLHTW